MLSRNTRRKIIAWLAIHIGTPLLNVWFSTCRIQIQGMETHRRFFEGGEKVVAGTWHRGAIFLVWYYRRLHPLILFSQSRDGELIAGFAEKLGAVPVRGSTSRGGRQALRDMLEYLAQSGRRQAATVLDGPRGPRFVAQKGMLFLAKNAGLPLQPLMFSAHPAITLKKAWDRTIIPLPFSRVLVSYREPMQVPRDAGSAELEKLRLELQTTLNRMMVEADTQTGYKEANPDVYADYFETG
jgi:lysophospholipid acyltransferase (LPLAT)-like uncharacterized protein